MASAIPTTDEVRERLVALPQAKVKTLAEFSGIPFGTLMGIRVGATKNPGIETVRAFYPLLEAMAESAPE